MSLTINTNIEAMNAERNLQNTENSLSTSMQRLSSGLRINTAADDVAGYAISQTLTGQVNGLMQAQQNTQDAVALTQTAQGSINEVEQMLQRVRELAVQYKNGTNSESAKEAIVSEVGQLNSEIERVGETTQFNGISLLKEEATITFQVGANDGEVISVNTISLGEAVGTISLGEEEAISNDRRRHRQGLLRRRRVRRGAEPSAVHLQQPGRLQPEPGRGGELDRRRQHGDGDDELHQGPDPDAGRHRHPGAGQLAAPGSAEAARLDDQLKLPQRWRPWSSPLQRSPSATVGNNASRGQGRPAEAIYRRFIEGTVVGGAANTAPPFINSPPTQASAAPPLSSPSTTHRYMTRHQAQDVQLGGKHSEHHD